MRLSGRPLLDNAPDMRLLVDRERELDQLVFAARAELNVLLSGDPGSGKTTLARALMYRTRQHGAGGPTPSPVVIYVHGNGVAEPDTLLRRITDEVELLAGHSAPRSDATVQQDLVVLRERAGTINHYGRDGAGAAHPLIVVDDVDARAGHGLFGRLRDQLWELPYAWLVTVRSSERAGLMMPPADAFFERQVELGPLGPGDVGEFIRLRTDGQLDDVTADVMRATGGNPRQILDALRDLVGPTASSGTTRSVAQAREARDQAIKTLGRPESMLAAELAALGAASASDEALLSRLGWTRARATQVFRRLEEAGLVRSESLRNGPGRPRKVYRLTPSAQFVAEREANDGT